MLSASSEIVEEKDEIKKLFQAISGRSAPHINGDSKPTSIKKAFRDFSLSKASEMAAVRRIAYRCASPQRIQTLYNMLYLDAPVSKPNIPVKKREETRIRNIPVWNSGEEINVPVDETGKPNAPVEDSGEGSVPVEKTREETGEPNVPEEKKIEETGRPNVPVEKEREETGKPSVSAEKMWEETGNPNVPVDGSGEDLRLSNIPFGNVEEDMIRSDIPEESDSEDIRKRKVLAEKEGIRKPNIPSGRKGADGRRPDKPVESKEENSRKSKMRDEKAGRTRKRNISVAKKGEESRTRYIPKAELNLHRKLESGGASRANFRSLKQKNSTMVQKRSISKKKKESVSEICTCEVESDSEKTGKEETSLTSKSSGGECSTSTSNSEGTLNTRPSCGIKPHKSKDIKWEEIRRTKHRDGYVSLNHFNLVKKLGGGDIGTVYLAELVGSSSLFAIKVMDNLFLSRRKKMQRAHTEREILKILDHPFLPTLYTQFTYDNLSCLVMEYCPGGDLHVLRQMQPARYFSEAATRFYVAEVLLALEYLHMLGIIYRDLKPENVLVGEDGHIMLTDFDLSLTCEVYPTLRESSTVTDQRRICIHPCFTSKGDKTDIVSRRTRLLPEVIVEPDARSSSFVGTHEYLAPEIIKGEGHGAAVDWWTLGVFAYEMMYGRTPFKGSGNEETLGNVVTERLRFPEMPLVSAEAMDLIKRLLVKDPERRLGWERGAAEIKSHPFFGGMNWALVRCLVPPESPKFKSPAHPLRECKSSADHLEFELF